MLSSSKARDRIIVVRDLNARMGDVAIEGVIGRHGVLV